MKIIGLKQINYISKAGYEVNGIELQCTYETGKVKGLAVEKVYIPTKILREQKELEIGDEVELSYNKFGKVDKVITHDNDSI